MPTTVITLSEALATLPAAGGALDADDKVVSVEDGTAVQSPAADLGGGTDTIFTSSQPGLAPASGGGITNFLRADAQWGVPPGGTGGGITAEDALDAVAAAFNAGTHVNVTFTHNDAANSYTLNATGGGGGITTEDAVDAVAAALAAGAHTNITVTYNDASNTLSLAVTGVQPVDADLTAIAGLTATTNNVIQSVSGNWASRTPAQLKTTLGLVKADVGLSNVDNTSDINKPLFTSGVRGLVPPPGAPTFGEFLRDDGAWVPAGIVVDDVPPADSNVLWADTTATGSGGGAGGSGGVDTVFQYKKQHSATAANWFMVVDPTDGGTKTMPAGWGYEPGYGILLPDGVYTVFWNVTVSGAWDVEVASYTEGNGTEEDTFYAVGGKQVVGKVSGSITGIIQSAYGAEPGSDLGWFALNLNRAATPTGSRTITVYLKITRLGDIPT